MEEAAPEPNVKFFERLSLRDNFLSKGKPVLLRGLFAPSMCPVKASGTLHRLAW